MTRSNRAGFFSFERMNDNPHDSLKHCVFVNGIAITPDMVSEKDIDLEFDQIIAQLNALRPKAKAAIKSARDAAIPR